MMQNGHAGTADGQARFAELTREVEAWASRERGVSRATLERLPVGAGTAWFPDIGREAQAIVFEYAEGWKARSVEVKSFISGKGTKASLWNLSAVLAASPKRVFLTVGELDACALVEAGIPASEVLAIPGASGVQRADSDLVSKGYGFVQEALQAGLKRVQQFIWCGDEDEPGRALRADLVRILGAARFRFLTWPEGIKDANDMLRLDGPEALRDLVENGTLPWPVKGLFRMSELPEPPPLKLWDIGPDEWRGKVKVAPTTMSVCTGHPGHGKTALWAQPWFGVVRRYGVPACIASFETRPKPHYRRQLRTLLCGALDKHLSPEDRRRADEWIDERYLFIAHPQNQPELGWLLDKAEVAVVRHGARIVQIDPWNRLEGSRPAGESETEYIGRCLRSVHSFAQDMNCHVQIVAHPSKLHATRKGEPPTLEDISGSKHWDNMVDQGFVVHRPELFDGAERKTHAELYVRKSRFEDLGYPCVLDLDYRPEIGRYVAAEG